MNGAKATVIALIAFGAISVPATDDAHADGPLLCGLLTPCEPSSEPSTGGDTGTGQPISVDLEDALDNLDLDVVPATDGVPVVPDTNTAGDTNGNIDIDVLPGNGRVIDVHTDVDSAALQTGPAANNVDLSSNSVLGVDARAGLDGVVVTSSGASEADGELTATRRLTGFSAAQAFCGIQVVIATSSSTTCAPNQSTVSIGTSDGLSDVAESVDLCGVGVSVVGSATTDCGARSPTGSLALGGLPSPTEAAAAAVGSLCGLALTVAGESLTTCATTPQAPTVPGANPSTPGTGGGAPTGARGGGNGTATWAAAGESQAQVPDDAATAVSRSGGSLPVTGVGSVQILVIAGAALAEGLMTLRSSRTRIHHLT